MGGYLNKDSVLSAVTKQNVIDICKQLGSDYRKDSNGNLIFNTCLTHAGGDSYKCYYYHEPDKDRPGDKGKRFYVYTEGRSYSLIDFVIQAYRVKGISLSWFQALTWIANKIGYSQSAADIPVSGENTLDLSWIERQKRKSTAIRGFTPINEHNLEVF
ncbi:MAG: hypothetical protein IJ815_00740, partial [Lachnospiraceae bacterium]|nr:hypothetical protein [Lachnospiraceae bacterium]